MNLKKLHLKHLKRMLGIGVCILLLLFFLSKTYLEVKSSQISYEKMDDPSFCMLDLNAEELAYMELHTEAVKVKHTTDEKYMQAMIDELNRSSLLGVGNSPWSEAFDHGGRSFPLFLSFFVRRKISDKMTKGPTVRFLKVE